MPNSNSEHSKSLRNETTKAWTKEQRKLGNIKSLSITLNNKEAILAVSKIPNKSLFLTNLLNLYNKGLISKEGKIND